MSRRHVLEQKHRNAVNRTCMLPTYCESALFRRSNAAAGDQADFQACPLPHVETRSSSLAVPGELTLHSVCARITQTSPRQKRSNGEARASLTRAECVAILRATKGGDIIWRI